MNPSYGGFPEVSEDIRKRRLKFTGYCFWDTRECIRHFLFWEPPHDSKSLGRPARTYVDCLMNDTGCSVVKLKHCMLDR